MTNTDNTSPPAPENPELVLCECRGCRALYRVICRGYGEPAEAFCVRCGSGLEICHAESAAWRNHIERKGLASEGVIRPPATERAPVLDMPRVTNDNALRVNRGKHALIVAAALEDYAVQCEDTSAEAAAAEWRDRARRDGILPTIQDDMLSG